MNNVHRTSDCEKNNKSTDTTYREINHNSSLRLNKAIAQSGFCSRRKADELIFNGLVKVDDKVEKNPATQVSPASKIQINGQLLIIKSEHTYIILNKPVQYICTMSDPQGRPTALDLLPAELKKLRLCPAGRLDYFSEGLLLLTDDGSVIQRLCHPGFGQAKLYEVIVRGEVIEDQLKMIRKGMKLDEIQLMPINISSQSLDGNKTRLLMELTQGVNREIRKICDAMGWTVLKLKRLNQGPLRLGSLPTGKWRKLTPQEIMDLKKLPALKSGRN